MGCWVMGCENVKQIDSKQEEEWKKELLFQLGFGAKTTCYWRNLVVNVMQS